MASEGSLATAAGYLADAVDGAEETWRLVEPLLPRFGITRVADITGLDEIGLPVHLAYRPASSTFTVTVGSGASAAQSRVSAVMESAEAWHAEHLVLPVAATAPASALDLRYDVRALNLAPRSPLTGATVLDWIAGSGLLSGRTVLVPAGLVRLDMTARLGWAQVLFQPTSAGLATGRTRDDAVQHALLELIERDSVAGYLATPVASRRYVDPAGCADAGARAVYQALKAAGCAVVVCDATGRVGLPCYVATIWSPGVPMRCGGYGCHIDPAIALRRALAEAVQSRVAMRSGARDDFTERNFEPSQPMAEPASPEPFPATFGWSGVDDRESVIRHCASLVAAVTGTEPLALRLDHDDIAIPAVKVVAPGLRLMSHELAGTIDP